MTVFRKIASFTTTPYGYFVQHLRAGLWLAIGLLVISAILALIARELEGWSGYFVGLGYAFAVVIYMSAILRLMSGRYKDRWSCLRLGREELRLAGFSLSLGLIFTFLAIVYTTILAIYGLTLWYVYVPVYIVFYGIALRLLMVAPLVVLEGKTPMCAVDHSWHLTTGHLSALAVSGVLVGGPIGYGVPKLITFLELNSGLSGISTWMLVSVAFNFMGWFMASIYSFSVYDHLRSAEAVEKGMGEALETG